MRHHNHGPGTGRRAWRARTAALTAAALVALGLVPLAAPAVNAAPAPVGNDFVVTTGDLSYILKQIKIAERHSTTLDAQHPCSTLLNHTGDGIPDTEQVPDILTSYGLRTVDGSCNNLKTGDENLAAADQPFPRLTSPRFRDAEDITPALPVGAPGPTSYKQKKGNVVDSQPRVISNLIVDQTSTNPAAVSAAAHPVRTQDPGATAVPCTTDPDPLASPPVAGVPLNCTATHQTLFIPNVTTDVGLSPPYNSVFTFFGQFFDHGVDQTVKSGAAVFVPLKADDPLIAGPDHVLGNGDDLPPSQQFMVLTRAQNQPGPDGVLGDRPPTDSVSPPVCTSLNVPAGCDESADDVQNANNTDTPWVDQSQTYTSHASHQVFLREYTAGTGTGGPNNPAAVATGKLLTGLPAGQTYPGSADGTGGESTWASVKKQAHDLLGLQLTDADVTNIPMLATDPYGKYLPGPDRGLPQYVTSSGLVEGNLANPVPVPADVKYFDTPFVTDIAHNADPSPQDTDNNPLTPPVAPTADANTTVETDFTQQAAGTYDDELLNAHAACGDGRCNENIALTSIHQVFHSEHNRLVDYIKNVLEGDTTAGAADRLAQWKATGVQGAHGTGGYGYGERLFQAARFVTEMEYQHLVFEEFARKVQPAVRPFHVYSPDINPAIEAEFAHAVYRFGHSMLDDTVARTNVDPVTGAKSDNSLPLLTAFLNPPALFKGGSAGTLTAAQGAGSVLMGSADQTGNELDEFVTETLRNNLLGLPLDLATINMTRAREAGVPPLNDVRRQIFADTNDGQLAPYTSWSDFGQHLKHPESLVNFVAAYGTHPSITSATTLKAKRDAARAIVNPGPLDVAPPDAAAFMFSTDGRTAPGCDAVGVTCGDWSSNAAGVTTTGLDQVDLWIGGLAEVTNLFGGLLGSTFNYVFQSQLEKLQDGDRLYYLARTPGMNLRTQLEGNSFSELIQRNTEGTNTLKADAFATADCKFQLSNLNGTPAGFTQFGSTVADDPTTADCDESLLLLRKPDGTIQYRQTNTIDPPGINGQSVYNGTANADRVFGGNDNDTFWGDGGNDVIEGGGGDDVALGGDGNDIITDLSGADVPKGGPGNDAVDGGIGDDILHGNAGQDFLNGGANDNESFAGPGNDFIIAGQGADAVFGDGGDDWIQGGSGQDLLQGDHGAPFFDDPAETQPGNDVFVGQVGENDYDAEGGDDVMAQNAAVDRNAGAGGFDWATHQYNTTAADDDMMINNNLGGLPIQVIVNRDRWQETEADSGGKFNDSIKGTDGVLATPRLISGGGFTGCDAIDQAGLDRINGLAQVLPPVNQWLGNAADVAALSASGSCPLTGPVWGEGDILIGGGGSDTLEGRAGDDILDGDRALTVRISVRTDPADPATETGSTDLMENKAVTGDFGPGTAGMTLQQAVFAGLVDPGHLVTVRDIKVVADAAGSPASVDTAVFSGVRSNYTVTTVNGTTTVTDTTGTDGTDTVRNVELLKFADTTVDLRITAPGAPVIGTASAGLLSATVNWSAPLSDGGSPIQFYRVQVFNAPVTAASTPIRTVTGIAPNLRSFVVTGLTPGSYAFKVLAENAVGIGPASDASNTVVVVNPAPTVTARTPAAGATNVITNTNITATFDVNVAGVTGTTFQVRRTSNNALVNAAVAYNATTHVATLNPNANLATGVGYTVTLTGGAAAIRNAATGVALATTSWQFTTDGTAPTVVTTAPTATSPLAGAVGVARNANVVTQLSEVVTGVAGNVTLRRGTAANPVGGAVAAAVTVTTVNGQTVITLNPNANLLANTQYTLRLLNGIVDTSGIALAPVARTFTTGP